MTSRSLGPGDVGRRVAVRHRLPDGRATDVVGELVELTADLLQVLPDDAPAHQVPTADVVAARVVPPRTVTESSAPAALERVATLGWPAPDTQRLGGWLLRAADGFTRRANSVLVAGDPGLPLPEALAAVRSWYAERHLTPCLQVPVPAPGDGRFPDDGTLEALTDLGWVGHGHTLVLTRSLRGAPVDDPAADDPDVLLDDAPHQRWLDFVRHGGRQLPPAATRVLTGAPQQVFATVDRDGEVVAAGRLAVAERWAGVTLLQVAEHHRRRGLGWQVLTALLGSGRAHGARFAYVQVDPTSDGALALFDRAGFSTHHAYHYLTPARA